MHAKLQLFLLKKNSAGPTYVLVVGSIFLRIHAARAQLKSEAWRARNFYFRLFSGGAGAAS
jgi:hypothetical protein